ncbi:unnamed protein product [Adineta ricciae]|uniref:XPG-I domain-containing protein n=1 Tax=Adineta ricciae TaxID=249248 RepID=A0A813U3G7_ADIRI|nr:unnamed protein product [Adineta ricciae]
MFASSSDQLIVVPDSSNDINEKAVLVQMNENLSTSIQLTSAQSGRVRRQHFVILILIFLISILSLCTIYILFPKIDPDEKDAFKIPKTIDDAKILGNLLYKYSKHHRYIIMIAFFLTYIFLQTFAIPGSIFLSILAGFLYPFPLALFLVCLCSSLGASFCYLLSRLFGRSLVLKYFHTQITIWQRKVQVHVDSLFWFMIFLRLTPILPNWFINICAPILDVPLAPFFAGTFVGVALPSVLFIQAEPACQQTSYEDLAGKTVAVDLSIWIIECRSVANNNHKSLYLETLLSRILKMIHFNIKPIFVLDSISIIELKLETVSKRLASENQSTTAERSHFNVLIDECSQLLTYLGLPIIRADGEAEKLCAQLNQMNIVDVVITSDSDCFVYGAKTIIRKFSAQTRPVFFDVYDRREIESTCHLNQRSLLTLALLLGSDYDSQGVRGIGPKSALKFLRSIPEQHDPVEYLRTILLRNNPQNKYERKVLNFLKENKNSIKHFDKIIKEYTSLQLDNVQLIASIASIKWLKPVRLKELQKYMEEKLQWMESLTFSKILPLLTRFQILYRLNMLELDVNDVLSLSDSAIFQPVCIKKVRLRRNKQYYEIEWKQQKIPSTQTLEDQLDNLSLIILDDDDDDEEKLITIEPADLFRHAYPEVVNAFETPVLKPKKPKPVTTEKKVVVRKKPKTKQATPAAVAMSTSMSLDLLSMVQDETCEIFVQKPKKFHHRPTMAALSTSINIDVLDVLQKTNININALKKSTSRPIKHKTQSDMVLHSRKPATLLNTSLSLDVLNIVLRENQMDDDDCQITDVIVNECKESSDEDVLPLPLWDRIRQRAAV